MEKENTRNEPLSRQMRSVYLITYSQCDLGKFPTRESFANVVVNAFSDQVIVTRWVCSREKHAEVGEHYHIAVKLDRNRRWLRVKSSLKASHGITVNFSSEHSNYYSAWRYVTKSDQDYVQSPDHPDLTSSAPPRTMAATQRKRQNKNADANANKPKKVLKEIRLTNLAVSDLILKNNIKTRPELLALANAQKQEGKTNLAEFVFNKGQKKLEDLIIMSWEMQNAEHDLARRAKSGMEILQETSSKECAEDCNGTWIEMAQETLERNNIQAPEFAKAVKVLLQKGRGKYRNLMIVGPANCGKTFMLNPLCSIFNCFENPASTTFACVGAESAEIIFLNDLRWSPQLISWNDFLPMLEGHTVHLPAPKTHYGKDLV